MALTGAFGPGGSTVLVDGTARQVSGPTGSNYSQYRVVNLAASTQYFSWGLTNAVTSVGAPSAGTPSANTIGMVASSVEVFTLAPNVWMIASSGTGFQVTPGEGL